MVSTSSSKERRNGDNKQLLLNLVTHVVLKQRP